MARVKWDGDFDADDIEGYEGSDSGYVGGNPTRGLYTFDVSAEDGGLSSNGNPKLTVTLRLVPDGSAKQKKLKGFQMKDFITITKSSMWRIRGFLDAIGVSGREFMTATTKDEEGTILKMGKVSFKNLQVRAYIAPEKESEYMSVKRYAPLDDVDDDDTDDDADDDAGDADGADDGKAPF